MAERPSNAQIAALLGLNRAGPGPSMAPVTVSFPTPRFVPTGSLKPTPKSISGSIQATIARSLNAAGMNERRANRLASRTMAPLTDATPVGNVTGAQEGGRQFMSGVSRGDLATAGLGALAFGLSVAPIPGGVKRTGKKLGTGLFGSMVKDNSGAIRAWHGSPHDFDKFDMGMLGTGEGNQAYGRGLYFSENPSVAGTYVQPRGAEPLEVPPEVADRLRQLLKTDDYLGFDTFGQAIHAVRSNPLDFQRVWEVSDAPAIKDALRAYDDARWPQGKRPRLYETDINAEPEQFYDLDAGPRISEAEAQRQGFKGFRFLDQGSRGTGNGTSNYVVFDDSLIDILNKY